MFVVYFCVCVCVCSLIFFVCFILFCIPLNLNLFTLSLFLYKPVNLPWIFHWLLDVKESTFGQGSEGEGRL